MSSILRDVLALLGLALLGAGLWMWWPPAALMVIGLLLLVLAVWSSTTSARLK